MIFSDNELSVCVHLCMHEVWGMGADEVITATDYLQRSVDKAQNTSKVMMMLYFMFLSIYLNITAMVRHYAETMHLFKGV